MKTNNENLNDQQIEELKKLEKLLSSFPEPHVPNHIMQTVQDSIKNELEGLQGRIRLRLVSILAAAAVFAIVFGAMFINNNDTKTEIKDNPQQVSILGNDQVLYKVGIWQESAGEKIDNIAMNDILTLWTGNKINSNNGNIEEPLEPVSQKSQASMQC
ncbi:MAG: hypothetical protein JEZ07_01130 [Phycisphaerae bacterium]|nr:hypothetical protein [Phycisphaerae bacterium]